MGRNKDTGPATISSGRRGFSADAAWIATSGDTPAGTTGLGERERGMPPERNRAFTYSRLTQKGRNRLAVKESQWKQMAAAMARVISPAAEER